MSFTVSADRYVAFVVTDLSGDVYTFVGFESEHEIKVRQTPAGDRYVFLFGLMPMGFSVRIDALEVVKVRLPQARENRDADVQANRLTQLQVQTNNLRVAAALQKK